jgi:hypothetical protein
MGQERIDSEQVVVVRTFPRANIFQGTQFSVLFTRVRREDIPVHFNKLSRMITPRLTGP